MKDSLFFVFVENEKWRRLLLREREGGGRRDYFNNYLCFSREYYEQ
jgi:hypothetical protein